MRIKNEGHGEVGAPSGPGRIKERGEVHDSNAKTSAGLGGHFKQGHRIVWLLEHALLLQKT